MRSPDEVLSKQVGRWDFSGQVQNGTCINPWGMMTGRVMGPREGHYMPSNCIQLKPSLKRFMWNLRQQGGDEMELNCEGWRYSSELMAMIFNLDLTTGSVIVCLIELGVCVPSRYLRVNGYAGWTYNLWPLRGYGSQGLQTQPKAMVRERLRAPCREGSGYYAMTYEMEGSSLT